MELIFKLVGMALVFFCTTSMGISFAQALTRRVEELETAMAVTMGLEGSLSYSLTPPDEAISRLESRKSLALAAYLPACASLCRRGTPFPKAWRAAVEENRGSLSPEDAQILAGLADTLGQCDLDGQLARLAQAQAQLQMQLEDARNFRANRAKLYRTMGMLSGAFLVILFI